MCGIAGFITKNKDYNAAKIVQEMLDRGVHRGPDQSGLATYNDTTIGMVRLSIIDTVEHTIPYEDSTGHFTIVYNGEIYNHQEIRKNLREYTFLTDSDTETAMVSFMEKGIEAFKEYNGMYAFAIHDKKKNETFIVRDKVGEKPIYYVKNKDFFAFASEIKSLIGLVEPKFNDKAVSYNAYEFTTGKETLFKDIFLLEPGEYIHIKNNKPTIKSYWKIWDNLIELPDEEDKILDQLAELVEDSILLRTRNSAHSFGAFVSGGIDSSLVACIAKPDHIYTAHYDYNDFNELDYAKLVAKQIKKELIIVEPNKEDFIRTQEQIAYHLDTPCTWTSFTLWVLMERISKDGLKVMLSGDGADEVFGGYHRYHLLHHDEQIHALEAMKEYSYLISRYYGSPVERYTKLINRSENPYDIKVQKFLNESIGFYFEKMQKDVVHAMGLNDFYSTMQVLLQMSDRMSMAFSIENRTPFLDYRLVQFAFSMSSKYKIKDGITKWALKEVARKFIPKEICDRTDKRGFSAPVNKWFEWDKNGKYNRSAYKNMSLENWKKVYGINYGK